MFFPHRVSACLRCTQYECGKIPPMLIFWSTLTINCGSVEVVEGKAQTSAEHFSAGAEAGTRALRVLRADDEKRHLGVAAGACG